MKISTKKELHAKTINELRSQLKEAYESYRILKLDHEMGKVKNTGKIGKIRDDIAVITTIINEKLLTEKVEKASPKKGGAK